MSKPTFNIAMTQIVSAFELRPDCPHLEGKYIAMGLTDRGGDISSLTTSLIESVDYVKGVIETRNSIYLMQDDAWLYQRRADIQDADFAEQVRIENMIRAGKK